ncbi:Ldh family oxidoreductase [Bryobacter aggregatus]|uniref:Ldh family oxidoreductase n=1 Tax=Bryobacter aggregatus TaxID=360054 RepID=UPI0004E0D897|nr:Ldh family oxidoreductase [Bryobacter aggregatus]
MPIIDASNLRELCSALLEGVGVNLSDANFVASALVASNLRGVDSHGVALLRYYLEQLECGDMEAHGDPELLHNSGCTALVDGHNAIGQLVAKFCCDQAIALAMDHGCGIVSARHSNHFGAAAYWVQRLNAAGFIGIVLCNASSTVAPWQGKEGRLGTNPICFGVPGSSPFLLDMATTTVAANKIFNAHSAGKPEIPAGWALDANGVPTTQTEAAYKGLLQPLGGYKGSGLAVMVEMLCGVLSGGAMANQLGGIRFRGTKVDVSQFYLALDPKCFLDPGEYEQRAQSLTNILKAVAPATGYDEVLVAGEPEIRNEATRRKDGIPLAQDTWNSLSGWANKLKVPLPSVT